ncbi:MAG: D-alanyl-D-alanine carboxypeptidase [Lachnospiraceae bacterium]|nr:D-alanyl-D-alanine carboxypeptidase [Lachnospiraceae bacterium]
MKITRKAVIVFVRVFIGIVLVVINILGDFTRTCAQETLRLYSKSAVLMDAESGRVLYEKCGYEKMPMASTTKIMTLIVTLENANLEDTVTVSSYASSMPDVQLNIREGEKYRLNDLLYSLMLESHNDSAVAIAEHVGGSVEGFADMMNKKARDIGCSDTYYITPNGLDAIKQNNIHSTTARDLALVMSYCIAKSSQKEKFLEITRTQTYSFCDIDKKRNFCCTNHNAFLNMMEGALSGKTGFTSKAGYCYVGALKRDGKTFVVALLACGWPNHKSYKWSDTRQLMEYGISNYDYYKFDDISIPENVLTPLQVMGSKESVYGEKSFVNIIINASSDRHDKKEGILLKNDEQIEVKIDKKKVLHAPVLKGDIVGKIEYRLNDDIIKIENLVTADNIEQIDFIYRMQCIVNKFVFRNKDGASVTLGSTIQ